jgi:hypothetical protein
MNPTWYEKGKEQGWRDALRELVEERFGPLPASVQERLQQLPAERFATVLKELFRAQSLHDLGLE